MASQSNAWDHFELFDDSLPNVGVMVLAILAILVVLLFFLPRVIFMYVLVTSIQMLKRRDYIEVVIKHQKHLKSLRSMRMYQVFKLIRRELIDYFNVDVDDQELSQQNMRILQENYQIFVDDEANGGDPRIRISDINQFCIMNGISLRKLESYVLLKKSNVDNQRITLNDLLNAIEQTTNDVRVDPYDVITTIFLLLKNEKVRLSVEDIRNFFNEYEGYFEQRDVSEFLDEVLSLQREDGLISIQEIASLIRDDIECYPR